MHDASYERAFRLLTSSEAKRAFALDQSSDQGIYAALVLLDLQQINER